MNDSQSDRHKENQHEECYDENNMKLAGRNATRRAQRQRAIERKRDPDRAAQEEQLKKAEQVAVAAERAKEKQREDQQRKAEAVKRKAKAVELANEKKVESMRRLRIVQKKCAEDSVLKHKSKVRLPHNSSSCYD